MGSSYRMVTRGPLRMTLQRVRVDVLGELFCAWHEGLCECNPLGVARSPRRLFDSSNQ